MPIMDAESGASNTSGSTLTMSTRIALTPPPRPGRGPRRDAFGQQAREKPDPRGTRLLVDLDDDVLDVGDEHLAETVSPHDPHVVGAGDDDVLDLAELAVLLVDDEEPDGVPLRLVPALGKVLRAHADRACRSGTRRVAGSFTSANLTTVPLGRLAHTGDGRLADAGEAAARTRRACPPRPGRGRRRACARRPPL